jgi:DNA-binding MarR family transcriptional regulator
MSNKFVLKGVFLTTEELDRFGSKELLVYSRLKYLQQHYKSNLYVHNAWIVEEMSKISSQTFDKKSVSKILARLEEKGLIERSHGKLRRQVKVIDVSQFSETVAVKCEGGSQFSETVAVEGEKCRSKVRGGVAVKCEGGSQFSAQQYSNKVLSNKVISNKVLSNTPLTPHGGKGFASKGFDDLKIKLDDAEVHSVDDASLELGVYTPKTPKNASPVVLNEEAYQNPRALVKNEAEGKIGASETMSQNDAIKFFFDTFAQIEKKQKSTKIDLDADIREELKFKAYRTLNVSDFPQLTSWSDSQVKSFATWIEYKASKKPLSLYSCHALANQYSDKPDSFESAVNNSIANNYAGLIQPKSDTAQTEYEKNILFLKNYNP